MDIRLREGRLKDGGKTAPRAASETILVVGDDDDVRVVAQEGLRRFGYTVLETADP